MATLFGKQSNNREEKRDLDARYQEAIERTKYRLAHPIFPRDHVTKPQSQQH